MKRVVLPQMVHSLTRRSHPPVGCPLDASPSTSRPERAVLICISGPDGAEAQLRIPPRKSEILRGDGAGNALGRLGRFAYEGVPFSGGGGPTPEEAEFHGWAFEPGTPALRNAEDEFEGRVRRALVRARQLEEEGPKVVVASELAFPVGRGVGPDGDFIERLRKLCFDHNAMIVAGSYHDVDASWFNLVPVIVADQGGFKCHPKVNTASKVGERVRTPFGGRLQVYSWRGMSFVPIVCLDSYDSGLVLSIAAENLRPIQNPLSPFDFVLVPSMNDKDVGGARNLCRGISEISLSPTVLVDGTGPGAKGHGLFREGEEVQPADFSIADKTSWFLWKPQEWIAQSRRRIEECAKQLPWKAFRREGWNAIWEGDLDAGPGEPP